jgi:hypothetical protein
MSEGIAVSAAAIEAAMPSGTAGVAARTTRAAGLPMLEEDLPRPMTEWSFLSIVIGLAMAELALLGLVAAGVLFAS